MSRFDNTVMLNDYFTARNRRTEQYRRYSNLALANVETFHSEEGRKKAIRESWDTYEALHDDYLDLQKKILDKMEDYMD